MAYSIPNRINNGDDFDAVPVDGNFTYLTSALNAYDGANISSGTIADSALINDPESIRGEIFGSFVTSGLDMSPDKDWVNLTGTFADGVAYIDGKRTAFTGAVKEFTDQKDTYVDIDQDGNFIYQELANEATEPDITINTARIAKVVTDGSKVIEYEDKRNLNPLQKDSEEAGFEPIKTALYGKNMKTLHTGTATATLDIARLDYSATVQNSFWAIKVNITIGAANRARSYTRLLHVVLTDGIWTLTSSGGGDIQTSATALTVPAIALVASGNDRLVRVTQAALYCRSLLDIEVLYRASNGSTTWEFI